MRIFIAYGIHRTEGASSDRFLVDAEGAETQTPFTFRRTHMYHYHILSYR